MPRKPALPYAIPTTWTAKTAYAIEQDLLHVFEAVRVNALPVPQVGDLLVCLRAGDWERFGIVDGKVLASIGNAPSGQPAPLWATTSAVLDLIGSTRGAILYRGATAWLILIPGAANTILSSNGPGADPSYKTLSTLLDTIGATQGSILYRGASGWAALGPGTSGQVLMTQGAAANPIWSTSASSELTSLLTNGNPEWPEFIFDDLNGIPIRVEIIE